MPDNPASIRLNVYNPFANAFKVFGHIGNTFSKGAAPESTNALSTAGLSGSQSSQTWVFPQDLSDAAALSPAVPPEQFGHTQTIMEQPTLVQCQQNNADEEDELPQPTQQPTPADNSNGADQPSQEGGTPQSPGGPGVGGGGGGGTPFIPPPPPGPPPAPWPGPGDGGPPAPPPGPPPADHPDPDPVYQPYDGGGHVRERLRPKESDEVKILAFPTGSQWRAWRGNTFASIVSAAGRQDDFWPKVGSCRLRPQTQPSWNTQVKGGFHSTVKSRQP